MNVVNSNQYDEVPDDEISDDGISAFRKQRDRVGIEEEIIFHSISIVEAVVYSFKVYHQKLTEQSMFLH